MEDGSSTLAGTNSHFFLLAPLARSKMGIIPALSARLSAGRFAHKFAEEDFLRLPGWNVIQLGGSRAPRPVYKKRRVHLQVLAISPARVGDISMQKGVLYASFSVQKGVLCAAFSMQKGVLCAAFSVQKGVLCAAFSLEKGANAGYCKSMKRNALDSLHKWQNSPDRKPLLLKGARQVGKTWLMKEFGRTAYQNVIYIDFYNNQQARLIFEGDLIPQRIVQELNFISGETIKPNLTLIIFDEIQECNRALNSLKYFFEEAPEYHIIAAGSFLGIALHENESFPVGKTDCITVCPMAFNEFLEALGEIQLLEAIEKCDSRIINLVKQNLLKHLKYYFYTGGMPEVVLSFAREKNFNKIRTIQKRILSDYEDDFSKHTGMVSSEKVIRLWNSIPRQLAREKKKFVYNDVKIGAKSRDYRSSLFWLSKCGLVYEVSRISLPHYPLASYAEPEHFKIYILDIGLLSALAGLDIDAFLDRDAAVFDHFYGSLAEQFVLQELKTLEDIPIYYWAREGSSKAEVDFVIQMENTIIPLEVKAERNLKAKSLKVYIEFYKPQIAIRASLEDLNMKSVYVHDIPLYSIRKLREIVYANRHE